MIFTAVGITLLLILVFLLVTWVLWFIFLLLAKLHYEASQTYFINTSMRTFLTNSFAVLVSRVLLLHSRITNHISKMNRPWLVLIPFTIFLGIAYAYGYAQCYKNNFSGQAEIQATKDFDEFKTYRAVALLRTPVDTTWRPFWDYYSNDFEDADNAIEVFEPWIKPALKDSNDIDFKILKVW